FGIVTEFTFKTHPIDHVAVAEVRHIASSPGDVETLLRFFGEWAPELPNHVNLWLAIEVFSSRYHGEMPARAPEDLIVTLLACSSASLSVAERVLAPMLVERKPNYSELNAMRLVDLQHIQDDSGSALRGMQTYMKSEAVSCLTPTALGGVAEHMFN